MTDELISLASLRAPNRAIWPNMHIFVNTLLIGHAPSKRHIASEEALNSVIECYSAGRNNWMRV